MKLIIFILVLVASVFSAEKFDCRVMNYTSDSHNDRLYLKAIYIDGVLRGNLMEWKRWDERPYWFDKYSRTVIETKYIAVKTDDSFVIKSVMSSAEIMTYKSNGEHVYSIESDTFYIPMSKNELNAARFTDDRGDKCLSVWFADRQ